MHSNNNKKNSDKEWFDYIELSNRSNNKPLIDINRPFNINTISSSKGPKNLDIKGPIHQPKMMVSPWDQSIKEKEISTPTLSLL